MSAQAPIIRETGEGDKRWFFGGGFHTWKVTSEQTDGAFFVFEDELTKGKTTPLHRHPEADEIVYVLEGEILVTIGGEERRVAAGGLTVAPKGVPHAFLVTSETCRLLTMQTPASGEAFYFKGSEPAAGHDPGEFDIARLMESAEQNGGVEILGPPPFAP